MLIRALAFLLLAMPLAAPAQELRPWEGPAAPPLVLPDLHDRGHRLSDYRDKVVLAVNVGEDARALPTTFVIWPDGRIRYGHVGARDWSSDAVRGAVRGLMRRAPSLRTASRTRVIDANEEKWRFFRSDRLPQTAAFDADQGGRFASV